VHRLQARAGRKPHPLTAFTKVLWRMAQSEGSHHHKVTNKASSLWRTYGQPLYSKSGLSHRISGLAPDSLISRETLSDLTSDDADLQLLEQAQSTPADIVEAITLFPSYARECTGVKNMKDRGRMSMLCCSHDDTYSST